MGEIWGKIRNASIIDFESNFWSPNLHNFDMLTRVLVIKVLQKTNQCFLKTFKDYRVYSEGLKIDRHWNTAHCEGKPSIYKINLKLIAVYPAYLFCLT